MSDTPDYLLRFPKEAVRRSFDLVPETCQDVRDALDVALHEMGEEYLIAEEDRVAMDLILSRAFCAIREKATVPLRIAHVQALSDALEREEEMEQQRMDRNLSD